MTNQINLYPLEVEKSHKNEQAGQNQTSLPKGVDGVILAFLCLLETAVTTVHNASIRAKELQSNASAQQKLNAKNAALQFAPVPKEIIDHHKERIPHVHTRINSWFQKSTYTTYSTKMISTIKNSAIISEAEDYNQEIFSQRRMITEKMNTLEQSAQAQESEIGVLANMAADTDSEAAKLMNIEEQLTYDACLTQPQQQ